MGLMISRTEVNNLEILQHSVRTLRDQKLKSYQSLSLCQRTSTRWFTKESMKVHKYSNLTWMLGRTLKIMVQVDFHIQCLSWTSLIRVNRMKWRETYGETVFELYNGVDFLQAQGNKYKININLDNNYSDHNIFSTLPLKLEHLNHMHQTCYIYN